MSKAYRLGQPQRSLRASLAQVGRTLRRRQTEHEAAVLWALRDVSFELERGEILGVIGPNGAGKTTILKLLSHITQPTSGRIDVQGRLSALIELGAGFHPELTGRENIYLNAAILGLSSQKVDAKFDEIVAFSGLARFLDTPVKRYSSGMYVRLGFSVAAHIEPEVLLVDEVLAVGDAAFQQRCVERIEQLRRSGTALVFVSHNLYLVNSVCRRALFLAGGRVQAQGQVAEVIHSYERFVRESGIDTLGEGMPPAGEALAHVAGVQVRDVQICRLDGGKSGSLRTEEGAQVWVGIVAQERLDDPSLVVRIVRSDGVTCSRIRTSDLGFALGQITGAVTISMVLDPLQLASGMYKVQVRLLGTLEGIALAEGESAWFHVRGPTINPGEEATSGVFVPNVAWVRVTAAQGGPVVPREGAP